MEALCPVCEKRPSDPAFKPFCSKRCADIDLGRWLKGSYVVPGAEVADQGPDGPPRPGEDPEAEG